MKSSSLLIPYYHQILIVIDSPSLLIPYYHQILINIESSLSTNTQKDYNSLFASTLFCTARFTSRSIAHPLSPR